jgi:hypothetical protein
MDGGHDAVDHGLDEVPVGGSGEAWRADPTNSSRRCAATTTTRECCIAMYFDDHGPPHFHARHADGEAKVQSDTLEVIDSTLGRRQLRFVLAWAELHRNELADNWRRARAGETLREIEPLR